MSYVIAVAGKGGVGKTTLSGLMIQYLCETGKKPVLAVDADANSNLNEVLGIPLSPSLGDIREELEHSGFVTGKNLPEGVTMDDYASSRMDEAITIGGDYDLMVMGRSQGKECYCYINALLKRQISKIESNYPYMLVDNEAGMEHISRGLLPKIDAAILVSDCSRRGVQAAGRIAKLMDRFKLNPTVFGLVINRAPDGVLDTGTAEEIENQGLSLLGVVPDNDELYQFDCDGMPLVKLPENSPVKLALHDIFKKLGL